MVSFTMDSKLKAKCDVLSMLVCGRRSLTVSELATILDEKPIGVIKYLMSDLGIMASMTQAIDRATSIAVAEGFGKIVVGADELEIEYVVLLLLLLLLLLSQNFPIVFLSHSCVTSLEEEGSALLTGFIQDDEGDESELEIRPPVVTIMGHVRDESYRLVCFMLN
jgi:Translation initiation factor IF-2, N-terminal region